MAGGRSGSRHYPNSQLYSKGQAAAVIPNFPTQYTSRAAQQVISAQDASGWPTLSAFRPCNGSQNDRSFGAFVSLYRLGDGQRGGASNHLATADITASLETLRPSCSGHLCDLERQHDSAGSGRRRHGITARQANDRGHQYDPLKIMRHSPYTANSHINTCLPAMLCLPSSLPQNPTLHRKTVGSHLQ